MKETLSPLPTKPRHLPGLNTLRAYAAMAVIFVHINQNIAPLPIVSVFVKYFFIDSQTAVSFFFVLSGFLISYLLLIELETTRTVDVSKFYLRRALRILPPYYLIATVGLFLFSFVFGSDYIASVFNPDNNSPISAPVKIFLVFCLLPNFASLSAPLIHLWSIGVEEQFYFAWPWVFYRQLNLVQVCMGIIIIKLLITPMLVFLFTDSVPLELFNNLRFECMAIGSLGAYCYYKKHPFLKTIYHSYTQLLACIVFIYLIGRHIPVDAYNNIGVSIVFTVLILNIATNHRSIVKLNYKFTERLGKVSYGMYLYHFPILYLGLRLIPRMYMPSETVFSTVIFLATLGFTWLFSELSYWRFEIPFLNLKARFTISK